MSDQSPYSLSKLRHRDATSGDNNARRARSATRLHWQRLRRLSLLYNYVVPSLLLLAAGLVFWLLGTQSPPERPDPDDSLAGRLQRLPPADVRMVRALDEIGGKLDLEIDGVVVPFRELQVAAEVEGRITYKDPACRAGSFVEQGQLLCRIDAADYELDVQRLTQVVEQEYEAIRELDQELANSRRLLEVAARDLKLQTRELERLQSLPGGFASETELDLARRAQLQAEQSEVMTENQLNLLQQRRRRLESAERLANVQLEQAKLNVARTEIRAPVSGVIVREEAELNSFVNRGSVIIAMEDTSQVEVAVNLRMDQLFWVLDQQGIGNADGGTGQRPTQQSYELPETSCTVQFELAGRAEELYTWQGRLLRYDGIGLDEQTRMAPVRIVVDNPSRFRRSDGTSGTVAGPSALIRGMFVSVILHINPRTPLVLIPALALQPGQRTWKFTVDPSALQPPELDSDEPASAAPVVLAKAPTDDQSATEEAFRADAWAAGLVKVLDNVRTIQAVSLPVDKGAPGRTTEATQKYYVCEVVDRGLQPGDFVVITPLVSIAKDRPLPVRVPRRQVDRNIGDQPMTAQR